MATKEEIQALAKKPYEDLTPEERRLVNLNKGFWEKGQSGNPRGPRKGCRNWSTIFHKLMGNEDFLHTIVKSLPKDWQDIVEETPAELIAAGLVATIAKGVAKCLVEEKPLPKDIRDAISLLNKIGYGDKVVYEDPDGVFERTTLNFRVVKPAITREEDMSESERDNNQ